MIYVNQVNQNNVQLKLRGDYNRCRKLWQNFSVCEEIQYILPLPLCQCCVGQVPDQKNPKSNIGLGGSRIRYFEALFTVLPNIYGKDRRIKRQIKCHNIIGFWIISKFTVNPKDNRFIIAELHHRHFLWKSWRYWEIFLDGGFQSYRNKQNQEQKVFTRGNFIKKMLKIDA